MVSCRFWYSFNLNVRRVQLGRASINTATNSVAPAALCVHPECSMSLPVTWLGIVFSVIVICSAETLHTGVRPNLRAINRDMATRDHAFGYARGDNALEDVFE